MQVNSLIEDGKGQGQMIKVSNFQALITETNIFSEKYREIQQSKGGKGGTQQHSPEQCLSPIDMEQAPSEIQSQQMMNVDSAAYDNSRGSGSGGSGASQKVVVISSDMGQLEKRALHVTSNSVQPIFKVEKVPSNSLGSNTGSDKS